MAEGGRTIDAGHRSPHVGGLHPTDLPFVMLMSLVAIASLLVGSAVTDDCHPRATIVADSVLLNLFKAILLSTIPFTVTLLTLLLHGSLSFARAWGAFAALKAVHLAAVSRSVACSDARLPVYLAAAAGFPAASALALLSIGGRLGAISEAFGAAGLAVWFGRFSAVAWGVAKRSGVWIDRGKFATLVLQCVLAIAAAFEAARKKTASVEANKAKDDVCKES